MSCFSLILLSLLGSEQVVDEFRCADAGAAQAVWVASEVTAPVDVVADGDRPVLKLAIPFASQPKLPRGVIDRRVQLDLTTAGDFLLEAAVDNPQDVGHLTL